MEFRLKEPLHILVHNQEYIVTPSTAGVERNRTVFFFDTTRTFAVGFSREQCLENSSMFLVKRTLSDREIPLRDVLKVVSESGLPRQTISELHERIKSL